MSQQPVPTYTPQRPPSDTRGLTAGITSIICALLGPVVVLVTALAFIAWGLFGHRIPSEIFMTVAGLLELLAIGCGVLAILRAGPNNAGRITGVIGVAIAGLVVASWGLLHLIPNGAG